ncbi:MAG: WHG domain-containing protein [Hungatella sp.]|jgi:AcrR family transcriptional regulator|nr:WHG domain-containing protein [Hungatella sp.]
MPPKPKITADDILNAALSLIREYGYDSLNARRIAHVLNCSTKPLFRVYDNMESLKKDIQGKALEFYYSFLRSNMNKENDIFLSIGKNYIQFAHEEKELFKYIFLSNNMPFKSLEELINFADMSDLIQHLMLSAGISEKAAKNLFLSLWLLVHGIATMFATNPCTLDNEEIELLLINAFKAQYKHLKSEEIL